jgi:hypothetical protein
MKETYLDIANKFLAVFKPVSLGEMDQVRLMDRIDEICSFV